MINIKGPLIDPPKVDINKVSLKTRIKISGPNIGEGIYIKKPIIDITGIGVI